MSRVKATRILLIASLLFWAVRAAAAETPVEDQVREIASELRCVVCQNLSVADSPAEMAVQMRSIVREQLNEGKTPEEIKAYFVAKYGEWVLLAPSRKGFNLVVWILPFVVLGLGLGGAVFVLRRWARRKPATKDVDHVWLEQVRREVAAGADEVRDPTGARDPLLVEKEKLYRDLRELEFDYHAGKLSKIDYDALRQECEVKAALVLQTIQESPPPRSRAAESAAPVGHPSVGSSSNRYWVFAAGGAFLLLGGLTLGFILAKSVRPRTSPEDSITGDFLTGTTGSQKSRVSDIPALLDSGRAAFEKRDLKGAIGAFKKVLSLDAENPVANTFMGLILTQAGHVDGALLALDRALGRAPDMPLALWAKGMILYQDKRDFDGARRNLEKLVRLLPPGEQRNSVEQTIAQIESQPPVSQSREESAGGRIRGTIAIDSKLASEVDERAVLFIIARAANTQRGPPLAVKRVERPSFPLAFELGPENVMIPGTPLSGALNLVVRLDRDGNPMTREAGDMSGEYRGNPVEVGTAGVTLLIDQKVHP